MNSEARRRLEDLLDREIELARILAATLRKSSSLQALKSWKKSAARYAPFPTAPASPPPSSSAGAH
jgi:hypothetical protein